MESLVLLTCDRRYLTLDISDKASFLRRAYLFSILLLLFGSEPAHLSCLYFSDTEHTFHPVLEFTKPFRNRWVLSFLDERFFFFF